MRRFLLFVRYVRSLVILSETDKNCQGCHHAEGGNGKPGIVCLADTCNVLMAEFSEVCNPSACLGSCKFLQL